MSNFHRATVVCAGFCLATFFPSPAEASTILASYSGTYSIATQEPVAEALASLRLSIGPMFADCDSPGTCTELARLEGIHAWSNGATFTLSNQPAILAALTNGQLDLFSLSMNFGPTYSPIASGGGIAIFDTPLESGYTGAPVESVTLTIDHLLFDTASTPFGLSTVASLDYTLSVRGFSNAPALPPAITPPAPSIPLSTEVPVAPSSGGISVPQQSKPIAIDAGVAPTFIAELQLASPPPATPTPEPGTWIAVAIGLALVAVGRR